MQNRKVKLKPLHAMIIAILLCGIFLPGLVLAADSTDAAETSEKRLDDSVETNEWMQPLIADRNTAISDIVTEAYLTENAVSAENNTTNLVLNVTDEVMLHLINVYDADGDLAGYLRDDSVNLEYLEPGVNTIPFSTNYCPSFATPTDCVWHNFDVPDGVYTLDARIIHQDSLLGYVSVGPYFVKSSSSEITFDPANNPAEHDSISGKVSDAFIDWSEELAFDINDYLEASFHVLNEEGDIAKNGGLTLNQDGTFTISLEGLPAGNYSAEVTVSDAAGNTTSANSGTVTHLERIEGASRYSTAIEVSQRGWTSADTVILARGDDFADALAGAPLAHKLDAPILMTVPDRLLDNTHTEIKRLGARNVVILGGEVAISKSVSDELKKSGINVERIDGSSRFETAALIASEIAPNGTNKVVVANGMDFPDALSAASSAAKEGLPILLTLDQRLPAATIAKMNDLGVQETIVVGGETVVSEKVKTQLPLPTRLGGADRYGTNTAIAEYFGVESKHLYIATGQNYADALTGAVLAAKDNSTILLVHHRVPSAVTTYLNEHQAESLSIYGGEMAVSKDVENGLRELLQ